MHEERIRTKYEKKVISHTPECHKGHKEIQSDIHLTSKH